MSESGATMRDQGMTAFRQGRTDEAIGLLREAVARDPRDHRAYSVLGAALIKQGNLPAAIEAFEAARRIAPDSASIHCNLGLAYQRAGDVPQAAAAFQAALEVDPAYDKARDALNRVCPGGAPAAATTPAPEDSLGVADGARLPQAPPGARRMPTAPPPAPWQTSVQGAQASAPGDDFMLRPLGGAIPAGKDQAGDAPAAPWQNQEGQSGPDASASSSGLLAAAASGQRKSKEPTQADYDKIGIAGGRGSGILYAMIWCVLDYALIPYSLIGQSRIHDIAEVSGGGGGARFKAFLCVLLLGLVTGWISGLLIGKATARTKDENGAIAAGAVSWFVFAALMVTLLHSSDPLMPRPILGVALWVLLGVLVGHFIAGNLLAQFKRAFTSVYR